MYSFIEKYHSIRNTSCAEVRKAVEATLAFTKPSILKAKVLALPGIDPHPGCLPERPSNFVARAFV